MLSPHKSSHDTVDQRCSCQVDVSPTNYFLRPETHNNPHQSSQYDAFLSQAQDQCFTHLAKMRQNMVTYWMMAGFANH